MSVNIELKSFILNTLNHTTLNKNKAAELGIKADDLTEADVDENGELDIDEILEDDDLIAKFATLAQEEQKKTENKKDAEKEKEEQTQVKDKNNASV